MGMEIGGGQITRDGGYWLRRVCGRQVGNQQQKTIWFVGCSSCGKGAVIGWVSFGFAWEGGMKER